MSRGNRPARLLADEPSGLGRPFEAAADDPVIEENTTEPPDPAVEEALMRGYNEGLTRAQQELSADIEAFRNEVRASLARIAEYEKTFAEQHEAQLLELTLDTASRIVRERIDNGDEVGVRAFREALQALPAGARVRARLHPDDAATIPAGDTEVVGGRIEIVADDTLSRGGAVLESDLGSVDATIETAERTAREAVLGTEKTP